MQSSLNIYCFVRNQYENELKIKLNKEKTKNKIELIKMIEIAQIMNYKIEQSTRLSISKIQIILVLNIHDNTSR